MIKAGETMRLCCCFDFQSKGGKEKEKGKIITGYILYSGEVRKNITVSHPEATFGEISRMVGNEVSTPSRLFQVFFFGSGFIPTLQYLELAYHFILAYLQIVHQACNRWLSAVVDCNYCKTEISDLWKKRLGTVFVCRSTSFWKEKADSWIILKVID